MVSDDLAQECHSLLNIGSIHFFQLFNEDVKHSDGNFSFFSFKGIDAIFLLFFFLIFLGVDRLWILNQLKFIINNILYEFK